MAGCLVSLSSWLLSVSVALPRSLPLTAACCCRTAALVSPQALVSLGAHCRGWPVASETCLLGGWSPRRLVRLERAGFCLHAVGWWVRACGVGGAAYAARDAMTQPSEATVPAALACPELRRFELRRWRVAVGKDMLSVVVPDAHSYLRAGGWVDDAQRQHEPPYWVQVWPASLAMARWMDRYARLGGLRVLDLGCGLGLPGITAARRGAAVLFADRNPDALRFARWNATQGTDGALEPEVFELDWSRQQVAGQFDVLCLADITYRPVHHAGVLRHVQQCRLPRGVVLHAEPWRAESTSFVRRLQELLPTVVADLAMKTERGPLRVRLVAASAAVDVLAGWQAALPRSAEVLATSNTSTNLTGTGVMP